MGSPSGWRRGEALGLEGVLIPRELPLAGATVVDPEGLQGEAVHRLDHEMDQVVLGHPIAQVRRQEHRRVTVYGDKSVGHGVNLLYDRASSKSDRLLAITLGNYRS